MGYNARFVIGFMGKYDTPHAWSTYEKDGKTYILEPQAARISKKLPRLNLTRYKPINSVCWDGTNLQYYAHEKKPIFTTPFTISSVT